MVVIITNPNGYITILIAGGSLARREIFGVALRCSVWNGIVDGGRGAPSFLVFS